MLKACPRCGKLHEIGQKCPVKRTYKKRITKIDKFRSTREWQKTREQAKERDGYMCQVCARGLYNTVSRRYNSDSLQVHHITPVNENWERRLDETNLICLCPYHHRMAEDGAIPREALQGMITYPP